MRLIHKLYIKLIKNFSLIKIKYLFIIFLLSPFLIFIVLIKPIVLIRFGNLGCERIGRFYNAEMHLLLRKYNKKRVKSFNIWVTGDFISNEQYLIILKRKFLVIQQLFIFYKVLELLSKYINIYSEHIITLDHTFKNYSLFYKHPIQLNLTKQEINKGELILKQFGIPKNAKIICITSRDNLYLRRTYPSVDFSYHNYRDSNVNNYIPAIKALIKKNFYVVRMGKIAAKRLDIKSSKFVDYPFHPLKSDFMDFFFAYKCYFWICSNAGIDEAAKVFRKPLMDSNIAPLTGLKVTYKKVLLCLKIHKNYNNKKLSLNEIFDCGVGKFCRSEEFRRKKIKLNELNANQIIDTLLEMTKLMKDSWKIKNKNDLKLQKKFRKLYLSKIKQIDPEYKHKKVNALYSLVFLKKNPWFLK